MTSYFKDLSDSTRRLFIFAAVLIAAVLIIGVVLLTSSSPSKKETPSPNIGVSIPQPKTDFKKVFDLDMIKGGYWLGKPEKGRELWIDEITKPDLTLIYANTEGSLSDSAYMSEGERPAQSPILITRPLYKDEYKIFKDQLSQMEGKLLLTPAGKAKISPDKMGGTLLVKNPYPALISLSMPSSLNIIDYINNIKYMPGPALKPRPVPAPPGPPGPEPSPSPVPSPPSN